MPILTLRPTASLECVLEKAGYGSEVLLEKAEFMV
jgi:hypothetical protein